MFINDYITEETRGRAFGLCHLGMDLGLFFSSGILFRYTCNLDPMISHFIAGSWLFIGAFTMYYLLTEPIHEGNN